MPFVRKWFKWVHLRSFGNPGNYIISEENTSAICGFKKIENAIEVVKLHAIQSKKYWDTQKLRLTIYL